MDIRPTTHALLRCTTVLVVAAAGFGAPAHAGGVPRSIDGDAVVVGAGTARTYVTLDEAGTPTAVGVRLGADALDAMPIGPMPATEEFVLALPSQAAPTVFDHVTLDWNSHGHNPEHGFDVPHIDVHFYLVDEATRASIDPFAPGYLDVPRYLDKASRLPDRRYLPAGYEPGDDPILGTVPRMGLHWIDTAQQHEHHFTETVLHGSWDGRLIFVEPMMTRDWLTGRPRLHEELPQPEAYQYTGLYPTTYAVNWDDAAGEYIVELGGLTPRDAS